MQMGPADIERAVRALGEEWGAEVTSVVGVQELVSSNYPQIAAVGMGATESRAPRIVELAWRSPCADNHSSPVVIIGKGVTFDTGGLNMKSAAGMRQMKKDMGNETKRLFM